MSRLTEILSAVEAGELSDETVGELHAELLSMFADAREGKADGIEATDVKALTQIVETAELLAVLAKERYDAAAAIAMTIAELEARLETVEATEDMTDVEGVEAVEAAAAEVIEDAKATVSGDETDEEADMDAEAVVAEAEAIVEEAAEPVVASAPKLAEIAKAAPKVVARPRAEEKAYRIQGVTGELASLDAAYNALADAWNSGMASPYGDRVRVARVQFEYPEDRVLSARDGEAVEAKIDAVVASGQKPESWTDSLVASGGWCAPFDIDYSITQTAGNQRPVTASLPRFQATRGGVRLTSPLPPFFTVNEDLVELGVDAEKFVTVWDADTDADPDGATKGIDTIECPEFTEFETAALVKRMRFSNFMSRAYPENVAVWTERVFAAHAHAGETLLLDGIKAASTAVTVPQTFGAARDIAEAIKRAATGYRSRHRNQSIVLRALVPSWVVTLGDIDLQRGAHSDPAFLTNGEGLFRQMLSVAGVNVTFYEDTPTTGVSQVFGAQGANPLNPFPTEVQWGLYDEGHFLFLDGGTLDLGVVRDSALNEVNDYETFVETFEGLAVRGSEALWITSGVCADGTSAAPVEDAVECGS